MNCRFYTLPFAMLVLTAVAHAQLYWDTTPGLGNGVGGSGTPGTTYSTTSTGDATLTTATTSSDLIFQGTAGTISLGGTTLTANSFTFNTTGYTITNTARGIGLIGPVTLGAGVNLNLQAATGDYTTLSSVTGGTGSSLTLVNGAATEALTIQSGSTVSVPVLFGNGQSVAVGAGGSGGTYTGAITYTGGGSGTILSLGNATYNGTISDGTSTVDVNSAITLAGSGNTWGATNFTSANSASINLGATNALPTGTTVTFNAGATFSNVMRLYGNNTTVGQITVGGGSSGTNTIANGSTTTAATLTISGSDTSGNFSGSIINGSVMGAASLALVRSGTGTTTLSGNNTYSGGTTISGGQLIASSTNALGTGSVTLNGGALTVATSSLTLGSGSSFLMNGGTLNLSLGTSTSSLLGNGGTLNITGGTLALMQGAGFSTSGNYSIFSGFSSQSVSDLTITGAPLGYTADLSNTGTLTFSASAVPEPSTYALIMAGAALAAAVWRRGWSAASGRA